jgi:hypothetical protein
MRKLIVVLMAVLMLVSFTSCNQDKIDELEKKVSEKEAEIEQNKVEKETFTEFVDAFQSVMAIEEAYEDVLKSSSEYRTSPITLTYDANDSNKCIMPDFEGSSFDSSWIYQQTLLKNPDIKAFKFDESKTSGTVTYEGTLTSNNLNYKIVNNVIAVKYNLDGSDNYLEEPIKLVIDGSLSCKTDGKLSSDSGKTVSFAFNGTICGEEINLSFDASSTSTDFLKFTAAKINGKDVDLVLLNNLITGFIPIRTLYLHFGV